MAESATYGSDCEAEGWMTCVEEGLWQSAMAQTVRLGDDLCGGGPVAEPAMAQTVRLRDDPFG